MKKTGYLAPLFLTLLLSINSCNKQPELSREEWEKIAEVISEVMNTNEIIVHQKELGHNAFILTFVNRVYDNTPNTKQIETFIHDSTRVTVLHPNSDLENSFWVPDNEQVILLIQINSGELSFHQLGYLDLTLDLKKQNDDLTIY